MKKKELPLSPQQPGQPQQVVQFYRHKVTKQAGNAFEEDCREMEADGWRLVHVAQLSSQVMTNVVSIVAVYQK